MWQKLLQIAIIATPIVAFIYAVFTRNRLASWLKSGNALVFGYKGRGKDVLFQIGINSRGEKHYANMTYGKKTTIKSISDLSCGSNTFENFINDNIIPFTWPFEEHRDFYISDGGIFLPSQYDGLLSKKYPSLPIAYALSRQLSNMNIHANVQCLGRLWIKLREQADLFICAVGCIWIGPFVAVRTRFYEKYESAEKRLLPLKIPNATLQLLTTQEVMMMKAQYDATNGKIVEGWTIGTKWEMHFDTYYFRRYVVKAKPSPADAEMLPKG